MGFPRRALLLLSLTAAFAACDCSNTTPPGVSTAGGTGSGDGGTNDVDGGDDCGCPEGEQCLAGDRCGPICDDDVLPCGLGNPICCGEGQVCFEDRCSTDCGTDTRCGGDCCTSGEMCMGNRCVAECADESNLCGVENEFCCTDEQVCLSDACVDLGAACTFTEECEIDEVCVPELGRCLPRAEVDVCEFRPDFEALTPQVGCRWSPPGDPNDDERVNTAPVVANLTDDNDDGLTNTLDQPDIVIVGSNGCCNENATLYIVNGGCNGDGTMTTIAEISAANWPSNAGAGTARDFDNSATPALGNLDPAGVAAEAPPEIVAVSTNGTTNLRVIAFKRTPGVSDGSSWDVMWQSPAIFEGTRLGTGDTNYSSPTPSIADMNGDGNPEVIIGNIVLNGQTGIVLYDGHDANGDGTTGDQDVRGPASTVGVGNNAFLGPVSTTADLDGDGMQELVAGNSVYGLTPGANPATDRWTRTGGFDFNYGGAGPGGCQSGAATCDGYDAVADFDGDPDGEVVIVREGEVLVVDADGSLMQRVTLPGPSSNNESGPPTVADFDNDGRVEVGTASAEYYVLVDFDCTLPLPDECESEFIRWTFENNDSSSRSTGSSVFDFNGDGIAEVVYADEDDFYVLRGTDASVLYRDMNHDHNTRLEMPVVVDVNNDGKSEVLLPEATSNQPGLVVWTSANNDWVRTRRIWNQHTYHVTNVTEDGQIPSPEERNWTDSRLNNFRQNVQPAGLFDAPDLFVESVVQSSCNVDQLQHTVTIGNQGALGTAAGVPVVAWAELQNGTIVEAGVLFTTTFLLPGQTEQLVFTMDESGGDFSMYTFHVRVDDTTVDAGSAPGALYNECEEGNNADVSSPLTNCPDPG